MKTVSIVVIILGWFVCLPPSVNLLAVDSPSAYAMVVSQKTWDDAAWRQVVDALRDKHRASVIIYQSTVTEALPGLRAQFPRFVCFVAQPAEASREFVATVHRLTRQFDEDPYPDCFWGILTGYDAANALRIARQKEPLTVHKVASGTEVALDLCEQGVWYSELKPGLAVKKEPQGGLKELEGPIDTTAALVRSLTEYQTDLFVTSGHATERDWQIGFSYRNGYFRCEHGELYGLDTQGKRFPVRSPNPKVYLPVGNCLMGHIDGTNAMALAFLNSGGVCQMMGYTVPTWYGYAGWGCLDYFLEQPGRYTFNEAVFANFVALLYRLETYFPELTRVELDANGRATSSIQETPQARADGLSVNDARGLLYDRDTVAFYGDPAWNARMANGPLAWNQTLSEKDGLFTFEIKPNRGQRSFEPINKNGSQRGYRPIIEFLPRRLRGARILEGAEWKPLVADDFVLMPHPRADDPQRTYRIVFREVDR
jgi:hypothetical protein